MLRDSRDEKIRKAGIRVRTGHKSNASEALKEAESRLEHQDIVGTVMMHKKGWDLAVLQEPAGSQSVLPKKG
jgi:hypothetical protein